MNKTTISVQLCETDFWDVNSTWYTNHPKLTPCFRNTFLVWFPAIVFIIAAIIEYLNIRQARQARLNKIPWNFFNQSRLFVTLLLFLLNVSESIDHISTLYIYQSNYNDISETSREIILISERQSLIISVLIAPIIQALCFLFLAIIYIKQRKCGLSTSGPIWFYLFIHLICDIFEVYSVITSTQNYDIVVLIIKYVHLPTLAILFLIECRGDTRVIEPDFSSNQPNSPELQASFFSKISFCWVNSLIISGYQHKIEFSNLWKTLSRDKAGLLVPILRGAWLKPTVTGSRGEQYKLSNGQTQAANNIIKVVFKLFWRQMLFAGFLKLMQDSFQYTTPMVLKLFLSFMKTKDDLDWHGYLFAISLLIVQTLQSFFLGNYFLIMQVLGLQVKSMLVGGVYRKSLSLSGSSRLVSTSGEIVNLMAVDSQRFQEVLMYVHLFWSTPFQIILAVVLLYREIGWSVFAGVACMLLLLPSNALLARRIKRSQVSVMKTKDNRVKQMGEVLGGIKVIKLYAWENSFIANLIKLRSNELEKLGQILTLDAITNFLWACSPFVVAVVSFAVYVRADDAHILDAEKAFVSIALFNLLKFPLAMLPQLITTSILAYVSSKRLNQFLNSDEIVRYVTRNEEVEAIAIESGTLCWQPDSNERIEHTPTLKDINLHIKPGSFVAVVGQVACGKSSLLAGILGEMYHIAGRFNVCQSMHLAYVPQQAWIQNMTVRDNILFGSSLNDERYRQVLSVCSLEPDLEVLPAGDQSEIGEKGINLSGGQKQRVSLARACYSDADIFLLDDPLSALDSHVAKQVFDKVLSSNTGLLRHKTRVLATNSLFVLPYVDQVVVMENGRIVENGTYKDLMRIKGGQLANIMRQYTGKEEVVVEAEVPIKTSSKSPDQSLFAADKILKSVIPKPSTGKLTEAEKVETGSVNFKVYLKYLNAVSTIWFVIIVLSFISATSFNVAANVWLAVWSSDAEDPTKKSDTGLRNMRLIVYALLGAIQSFTMLSGSLGVAKGAIQAARKLHSGLLNRVMHSPMSFFDTTPIGRILNRFAKDIDVVDSSLPMTFRSFLTCLLQVLSTIFLLVYKFPDFLFIIVPLAIAYYLILKVFIKTTRQLKRLESNTRSPIYSHFSETLLGLSTIRAYDSVDRFVKQSDELVDRNQSCTYPNIMANRWLALRLEFFANTIAASAALFSAYHKSTIGAGIAGLTISYSLSITLTFNWLVRMMSDLETNIVSVERILEYMGNTQEDEWVKKQRPASDWPGQGAIQFQDYSTRYREDMELVLKNLSLNISPREKIGIVGRTGSGKSSLSLSLFRILEPTNGKIVIDRLNILDYGLHDLRSKLTIIPQDPVLFSGSLRFNLDPLNAHTDLDIWRALELAHLKTYVSSLKAGLDYQVSEYAENFSMGQRQLICLARAILRQSKILILDEATASIDLETDSIVQKTIRDTFSHCTIITIAHRLHTILDSDRIMVLDRGCVMELDSPMELISNPNSAFSALARDAGIDLSDIRNSS